MSRIGKLPITIPQGVTATLTGSHLQVAGPKGKLERTLAAGMEIEIGPKQIRVLPPKSQDRIFRGLFGLTRTLINNMVLGVTNGFHKNLEIQGIGYKAEAKPNHLTLNVGYSHQVDYKPPQGVKLTTPKPTQIVVSGIDKQLVGQVAAELRFIRKPEPYKGKGVRYEGEYVRIKVGKAAAVAGGSGAAGAKK